MLNIVVFGKGFIENFLFFSVKNCYTSQQMVKGWWLFVIIQLGLTLVIPLLACLYFCYWLCEHKGVGSWVYIIGLIFGIGAGIMTWYKLYLRTKKHNNKKKDKKPFGFNDHV